MTDAALLKDMPLQRYACTDCRYLVRKPESYGGGDVYRCGYFDTHAAPMLMRSAETYDLNEKRVHGPHCEDMPVRECATFEARTE